MTQHNAIKLFEEKRVRTVWDDQQEKWYFSVVDVVAVLTDSANPTDYLKKMRKRDPELAAFVGTNCPQVAMLTETGKKRQTLAADTEAIFRIIQSIPSPKAEPFKLWMARVASERIDQMQDPELSINQALMDYKRLGYSDNWINQRLKSIGRENRQGCHISNECQRWIVAEQGKRRVKVNIPYTYFLLRPDSPTAVGTFSFVSVCFLRSGNTGQDGLTAYLLTIDRSFPPCHPEEL